jgi:hypothetical protein
MSTQHGFESFVDNAHNADNMTLGDHVLREGYSEGGDKAIMDILSANEKLVSKYTEQVCNHFSNVLCGLPEGMQKSFVDSLRVFNDKNDVVYKGMVARYDDRVNTNA